MADGSGNWSLTSLDSILDAGDSIVATALAANKSISSDICDHLIVSSSSSCTDPINDGGLVAANSKGVCGDPGSAIAGAEVKIYSGGSVVVPSGGDIYLAGTITAKADSSWIWSCNGSSSCSSGPTVFF